MALYAFDGTWNEDDEDDIKDTNVVKFSDAYDGKVELIAGVGTRFGLMGRFFGGVFGAGGKTRIHEMHDHLVRNWKAGDHVIDIIGFSRGAALAVHFTNVLKATGIDGTGGTATAPPIRFLGIWELVSSFGIPINFVIKFQEIDIGYTLSVPDNVERCFHALALDERRQIFQVTRLDPKNTRSKIEEQWFRGVHTDVGGGQNNWELSNIALNWMFQNASNVNVPLKKSEVAKHWKENKLAPIKKDFDPIKNPRRIVRKGDVYHPSAKGEILQVGQTEKFTVRSKEQYSWSGYRMVEDGYYTFSVDPKDTWKDASLECDANGWKTEELPWYKEEFVELFEGRRRCPKANWFELIGSLGNDDDHYFRIGLGGRGYTFQAPEDGELYAFANDLRSKYGNNTGEVVVTVTRVDGPGSSSLKTCLQA